MFKSMKTKILSLRPLSGWGFLILLLPLAYWVRDLSPENFQLIPYKLLIVIVAMYLAHRYHRWAFKKRSDGEIYKTEGNEIAMALVYGATVLAMAIAL